MKNTLKATLRDAIFLKVTIQMLVFLGMSSKRTISDGITSIKARLRLGLEGRNH